MEELEEIDVDEEGINNGTKFEAIKLNGSYSKVDNKDCPSHHARPAIGPLLNVHTSKTRVKLYTSIELVRQRGSLCTLRYLRVCVTWCRGLRDMCMIYKLPLMRRNLQKTREKMLRDEIIWPN